MYICVYVRTRLLAIILAIILAILPAPCHQFGRCLNKGKRYNCCAFVKKTRWLIHRAGVSEFKVGTSGLKGR